MFRFVFGVLVNFSKKIIVSNKYLFFKNILRRFEIIWVNFFGIVFLFKDDKKFGEKVIVLRVLKIFNVLGLKLVGS